MKKLGLFAALGAIIGSSLRFAVEELLPNADFPWGTFTVNVAGSFLIGLFLAMPIITKNDQLRVFLISGVLGGFTTFSAVVVESLQLSAQVAIAYLFNSFFAGLVAALLAFRIGSKT